MNQSETEKLVHKVSLIQIPWTSIRVGSLIGHGGYGEVYKGTWKEKEVAVKQLHLKIMSDSVVKNFMKEAQIMAKCQSDYTVSLYGVCIEAGHYFMVMEYMPRGSLYQVLQNKEIELSLVTRYVIAIDIGNGLAFLHAKNILHRDLKSLNVLLDNECHAKIADFGLAKHKLEFSTSSATPIRGTVHWQAPESFIRGFKINEASDIYSYGMVLWEIMSRIPPFIDAPDEITVARWIEKGKKEIIPEDCPLPFKEVIEKCWESSPNARPKAEEIIEILEKAKPVSTSPQNLPKAKIPFYDKSWNFASSYGVTSTLSSTNTTSSSNINMLYQDKTQDDITNNQATLSTTYAPKELLTFEEILGEDTLFEEEEDLFRDKEDQLERDLDQENLGISHDISFDVNENSVLVNLAFSSSSNINAKPQSLYSTATTSTFSQNIAAINEQLPKGHDTNNFPDVDEPVNRKGLKTKINDLILLPKEFKIGTVVDDGGCFFDALAQILNISQKTDAYSEKYLRILCYEFYCQYKELVNEWDRKSCNNETDERQEYNYLQYTKAELDKKFPYHTPFLGRPHIEGKMLCRILNLRGIVIVEILKSPEKNEDILNFKLITEDEVMHISEEVGNRLMKNLSFPVLFVSDIEPHFFPLLKNHSHQSEEITFGEASNTSKSYSGNVEKFSNSDTISNSQPQVEKISQYDGSSIEVEKEDVFSSSQKYSDRKNQKYYSNTDLSKKHSSFFTNMSSSQSTYPTTTTTTTKSTTITTSTSSPASTQGNIIPNLTSEQQQTHEEFISVLLEGNIVDNNNIYLTVPNKNGIYPFMAAVYGAIPEAVRQMENQLSPEESYKQWLKVNKEKVLERLMAVRPTELKPNATYTELGEWYKKNDKQVHWCKQYDNRCLSIERETRYYLEKYSGSWKTRGEEVPEEVPWGTRRDNKFNLHIINRKNMLLAPSRQVHDQVMNRIFEEFNEFKINLEIKASKENATDQDKAIQRQLLQERFIAVLYRGDLKEVKRLELWNPSFLLANKEGLHPLVAAVYGMNINAVKYIENKLSINERQKQWLHVDKHKALQLVQNVMPSELKQNATLKDLADWYKNNQRHTRLADIYNKECLMITKCSYWGEECKIWNDRIAYLNKEYDISYMRRKKRKNIVMIWKDNDMVWENRRHPERWPQILLYPSRREHDCVVKNICTQLNKLKEEIQQKANSTYSNGSDNCLTM